MVETAWEIKNRPADELRLQRTGGRFVSFPHDGEIPNDQSASPPLSS
jgi:hypothetical protein